MIQSPRGPAFVDVAGVSLTAAERERLAHPLVGGVILFTRNFESRTQLAALTDSIRAIRSPHLLIAVDHEGGRVQRFRQDFTAIPPMRTLGERWDHGVAAAAREATRVGYTIASELRASGIDFSFTPVLDLDFGQSTVIGDRALHRIPNAVAHLGCAIHDGLRAGGMSAVGKHFPGHGHVAADSHTEIPIDDRALDKLTIDDLVPFGALVKRGVEAIMPAHVIYPAVDPQPAGYSRVWLQDILRGRLGFRGMIFSDDLGMAGAESAGDMVARAAAAQAAGCDMVLVCNDPDAADRLLDRWVPAANADLAQRAQMMEGKRTGVCPT